MACRQVCADILLVDYAFGLVNIALVAKKAVDAGLEGFLNNEALNDDVELAPKLNQVGNQRIFAKVHSCSCTLFLPSHVLEDILGWYDTFPLGLVGA